MSKHDMSQGLPFLLEPGQTREEYDKLLKEWNEKLQKAGHSEIERFYVGRTGSFSPFFVNSSKTAASNAHLSAKIAATMDFQAQEYYIAMEQFYTFLKSTSPSRSKILKNMFPKKASESGLDYRNRIHANLEAFKMHWQGYSYRDIVKAAKQPNWIGKTYSHKSVYWAHWVCAKLISAGLEWYQRESVAKESEDAALKANLGIKWNGF